tara:strand:- start:624 stop:1076 length:453 start_codon:yes stop_codon:yes gene_type:complete
MAINGIINGQEYLLTINGEYVILGTTANIQTEQGLKDISCRETDNWNTSLLSDRGWSMGFEGKFAYVYADGTLVPVHTGLGSLSLDTVIDEGYMDQDRFTIALYPVESGTPYFTGEAYLTGVNITAPNEDSSTISLSFAGAGELTQDVSH